MNWEQYQKEFEWDGSLRDIYIFKTSLDDWQKLLDYIRACRYTSEYKIDGDAVALPERAATIFECENSRSLLSGNVGNLVLYCHFFTVDEIEFDLDPREVKVERDLEELFDFLRRLCRISNKQTVLTPENAPELWIFRFNPGIDEPEYQTS
jgi:hypothetical protein